MEQTQNRSPFLTATIVVVHMTLWMILITAVGMGTIHLNDCPIQRNIPVFLIVMGASGLFSLMLAYVRNTLCQGELGLLCTICTTICHIFLICWLTAGSEWIYPLYPPNYDPLSKDLYCQRRLYLFAFGLVCIGNIFICLVFMCAVFLLLFKCVEAFLQRRPGFSTYNRMYTAI